VQLSVLNLSGGDLPVRGLQQSCGERRFRYLGELTLAEQHATGGLRTSHLLCAVDQFGEFLGKRSLRSPLVRLVLCCRDERVDFVLALEAEGAQQDRDVAVVGIEPELEERIRAGELGIQPDRARFGLTELGAVRLGDQRCGERMDVRGIDSTHQVNARGDVAPLIRSPGLQDTPVLAEQLQVVVGLQQLVAELGVADAVLGQAGCHRFAIEHAVDTEVLAHIAQELQRIETLGPVVVVDHDSGVVSGEVVEPLELAPDPRHPLGNRLGWVQVPLPRFLWVADQAGRAANQR